MDQDSDNDSDNDKDDDNDKMPDLWEIKYKLDTNSSADKNKDKDGDGYTNYEEYLASTNPLDPDDHPISIILPIIAIVVGILSFILGAFMVYRYFQNRNSE